MTINEYLNELKKLPHKSPEGQSIAEGMADIMSIWSNDACVGYCRIAMEKAGIPQEQTAEVLRQLRRAFDDVSISEAEEAAGKMP